jgi:hypothetical protein
VKHPFFKGIDWKNIRQTPAPWKPDIVAETDTKYFDELEEFEEPDWFNTYDAKDPSTGMLGVFMRLHLLYSASHCCFSKKASY